MINRSLMLGLWLLALSGCAREVALIKGDMPALAGSLAGGRWLVEDLNGGGMPDGVRVDATFQHGDHAPGTVSGASLCNRFNGAWQQTGAAITLGPLAGTMAMCEPAKMDVERKFLQTMEAVRTVSFDADGAALLQAPDGRTIRLRREAG